MTLAALALAAGLWLAEHVPVGFLLIALAWGILAWVANLQPVRPPRRRP